MENLRISDLISNYCIKNRVSLVYYEIKYSTIEEREKICDFYDDKVDMEFINAMRNDDDCFFSFTNSLTAVEIAEMNFPTKREILGMTNDLLLYVFCCVYDENGNFLWDNSLE
jgi:hypothetical protein